MNSIELTNEFNKVNYLVNRRAKFQWPINKTNTLEMLDFTFHIGSTPTFLYFDLYLNTAYAAHYVY